MNKRKAFQRKGASFNIAMPSDVLHGASSNSQELKIHVMRYPYNIAWEEIGGVY